MNEIGPGILALIGVPLNTLAGLLSFRGKSVTAGGAVVGACLGAAVFIAAGPFGWLVLAAFVLSSTAFTRFRAGEKEWLGSIQEKGGRRDAVQVLANGGVGLLAALLALFTGAHPFSVAFAAAFASANADTWASELGVLSRRRPVSLVSFRKVPAGVSGGVTLLGCAASACGALWIAVVWAAGSAFTSGSLAGVGPLLGIVTAAGAFGSLVDSVLGSTVQAQYEGEDRAPTERRTGRGAPHRLARGIPWITNDAVNFLSTAAAAIAGGLLGSISQ